MEKTLMNDDKTLNSGVRLSDALEKIEISFKDGEISFVKSLAGNSDGFHDSFHDGPTWRDTFGDGGQWASSFNNLRGNCAGIHHPAIQEALQKVAAAIARRIQQKE
jgi:hypothetical protein